MIKRPENGFVIPREGNLGVRDGAWAGYCGTSVGGLAGGIRGVPFRAGRTYFILYILPIKEVAAWTGNGLSFAERRNSLWEKNMFAIR